MIDNSDKAMALAGKHDGGGTKGWFTCEGEGARKLTGCDMVTVERIELLKKLRDDDSSLHKEVVDPVFTGRRRHF